MARRFFSSLYIEVLQKIQNEILFYLQLVSKPTSALRTSLAVMRTTLFGVFLEGGGRFGNFIPYGDGLEYFLK